MCNNLTKRGWHHGGYFGAYKKTCSEECQKKATSAVFSKMIAKYSVEIAKASSERMKLNNPMWMEGIKEKAVATNKALGTKPKIRGGNGKEMPVPQRVLLTALGDDWYAEHSVATGFRPTCYKIDIASPKLMVAIEVDGGSHDTLARKKQDNRKDTFLKSKGWKVIRFKNKEVMSNLENVLKQIHDTTI